MKIFYIKPNNTSFIRGDEELLSKHFDVKPILLEQAKGNTGYFKNMLKMCFTLIGGGFFRRNIYACWFADYHAAIMVFISKITFSKSVIFIGGMETVCYPELGKGVYRNKLRGWFVKYALKNASLIIANHKSLIYHENSYYNAENPHIDGVKHYVKGFKTPVEIIYNGIDPEKFKPDSSLTKQSDLILTVGTMNHLGDFQNKGFDVFIQVAARKPELQFVLIGLNPNYLNWVEENYKVSTIKNLNIIPSFCPQDVLANNYNKAKVFVQASITEGMPNTLSEAMLLGCIPVGSNINGIPDAIGNTGKIIAHRNLVEIEKAIDEALTLNTSAEARQRVIDLFSFAEREQKLIKTFSRL